MNETLVVIVRGVIGYFTLLIFARILGKQQVSQLTFFDYILGITIGSIAATLTADLSSRAWYHWAGLLTWTLLVVITQWITTKSRFLSKYIDGEPTILIMNGKIMEKAMGKMRYRMDEVSEQLREKGVFDLTEVEFAILEKDGHVSVLKKSQYQPATPKDLNLPTTYKGVSTELIYNGIVIDKNLEQVKLSRPWLEAQLKSRGIKATSEVFVAILNTEGTLYIDTYKDKMENVTDITDYKEQMRKE